MSKILKTLDASAWLRRLGQVHMLDKEIVPSLEKLIQLPVLQITGEITPDQPYNPRVLTFRGAYTICVRRECVVSLEPFEETLSGDFERSYRLSPSAPPIPQDAEEAEDFPFEGLNLIEILVDEIALKLSTFPRKSGAQLPEHEIDEMPEVEARPNPFAVLERLK